jgi:DHA1 family multidrug resistance protein-like MFS transporter
LPLPQNAVLNCLADVYPTYAASVLAGNNFIRSMFGAAFPLFIRSMFGAMFPLFMKAMYINLGIGWANTLLVLLSCAFVLIPILMYKYGECIQVASKHTHHNYE